MIEACVTYIRETMQTDDREVWPIDQFEDRFGKRYVDAALGQMKRTQEIAVTEQQGLEGRKVPVIRRRR